MRLWGADMVDITYSGKNVYITSVDKPLLPCEYIVYSDLAHSVYDYVVVKILNNHSVSFSFSTMFSALTFFDRLSSYLDDNVSKN